MQLFSTSFLVLFLIQFYNFQCATDENWLKHSTIYQIYPRSFKDSNNDGIGDLKGIISELDFLKETGIDAIWLSPVYPSPMVDAGYDISDFIDIHPDFGTLDDFDQLVAKAKSLGIKIIMDFVPNHSSDKHKWFLYSENRTKGYEDFYVWKNSSESGGPPNNWISVFKKSAWTYSPTRKQWYLHQFAPEQPDLNYRNPKVSQEMQDVLVFWLDRGVSGFRIDAIGHLFEDAKYPNEPFTNGCTTYDVNNYDCLDHIYSKNQIETYWEVFGWRSLLNDYSKNKSREKLIMMMEAWENYNYTMMYYGTVTSEGATFPFNFNFITDLSPSTTAQNLVDVIYKWLNNMPEGKIANWVLGNHDQPRIATRLGKERVDGYNMVVHLLPGTSLTYNGEEIGMENGEVTWEQGQDPSACNGNKADFNTTSRDFQRTPYQWDNSTNAGFNKGAPTWLPVSSKYQKYNLKDQRYPEDKISHYHVYQKIISLRKKEPFLSGNFTIKAISQNIVGIERYLNDYDRYLVVFNLGSNSESGNVTREFPTFYSNFEVVITSINSKRKSGDLIKTGLISMDGYESLVLKTNNSIIIQGSFLLMTITMIFLKIFNI